MKATYGERSNEASRERKLEVEPTHGEGPNEAMERARLVRFGVRGGPRAAKRARRSVPPTAGQWTCNCDLNRRNNGSIASSEKRLSKVFKGALKTIACRNQAAGSGRRLWVTAKDAARGAPLWAVIHDPFVPISLKPKNQSAGEAC